MGSIALLHKRWNSQRDRLAIQPEEVENIEFMEYVFLANITDLKAARTSRYLLSVTPIRLTGVPVSRSPGSGEDAWYLQHFVRLPAPICFATFGLLALNRCNLSSFRITLLLNGTNAIFLQHGKRR